MNKVKWLGLICLFGAALIFGYQMISSVMTSSSRFINITLVSAFGGNSFTWTEDLPAEILRNFGHYVVNMPLYLLLVIVGIILLVISGIFGMK